MDRFWEQLASGVGAVLAGLGSVVGIRGEEQPRYEILLADGPNQVRQYAPQLVATTTSPGSRDQDRGASFRILAGYIFGGNRSRASIAMTTPVVMAPATEQPSTKLPTSERIAMTSPVVMAPGKDGWTMTFILPATLTRETAPIPNDPRVKIAELPAETLAVTTFSGAPDEATSAGHAKSLRTWLEAHGYQATGAYRFAGYDPPFTLPFMRRNEVMIPVTRPGGAPKSAPPAAESGS
jgi:hypothetical protein